MRRAEFNFLQSLVVGSRIIFLFPLVFLGSLGVFGAVGISFLFAVIFALFVISRLGVKPSIKIDKKFLNDSLHFSAGNYFAGLFLMAPNQLLPIMVLNVLGASKAAYYYISYMIASLLFMIPNAISMSLFVEGSHGESLRKTTIKSLAAIFLLLIPTVVLLYFAGGWLLSLVGKDYVEGISLLRIMVLTSIFVAITSVYFSIKRIQKDIKGLIFISGLIFLLLPILGYIFMLQFDLVGIGYAWIVSYGISAFIIKVSECRAMVKSKEERKRL